MKLIVDLEKKSLRILENERSIFRGEYGADKLELYINKTLENEYPTITALLSNGRKIGAYSTDEAYGTETIDGVTYTVASFTLSKENGFTLSEGQMQITIWMNSNGKKEAIGNVTLNVINTTAFDDGDIIISGDVEGTLVNYKVELENLQGQVNGFNGRLTNVETNKVDRTELNATNDRLTNVETNKLDKILTENESYVYTTDEVMKIMPFNYLVQGMTFPIRNYYGQIAVPETPTDDEHATSKKYVDEQIAKKADKAYVGQQVANLVNSAPETLDTLAELSKALNNDENFASNVLNKIGQLEQAVEDGVSEEQVMEIVTENSQEVEIVEADQLSVGTSTSYDVTSDNEIPTTKAVKTMIGSGASGGSKLYKYTYKIGILANGPLVYGVATEYSSNPKPKWETLEEYIEWVKSELTKSSFSTNRIYLNKEYDFLNNTIQIENNYYGSNSVSIFIYSMSTDDTTTYLNKEVICSDNSVIDNALYSYIRDFVVVNEEV